MLTFSTGVPINYKPQNLKQWGRARDDYEWFAARFCPIADKEVAEPHPLFLNSTQKYLKWYFETYRNEYGGGNFLIYKGRQFGCSTEIDTMFAHQALKGPGFKSMVFAHENQAADNLLSIVRRPYWALKDGYKLPSGDIVSLKPDEHRSSKKELWVYFDGDKTRESRVIIEEASAGDTAGASHALNAIHFSEVGKDVFDDGKAIGIAMQTLSRDAMVFAEGTANGAYGWMYNTWQETWDEFQEFRKAHKKNPELRWNSWVPIFLPWFWHYGYPGGLRFPLKSGEIIKPESEWEEAAMSGDSTYMHYKCTPENIKAMRYLWDNRIRAAASDVGMSAEEYRAQEYPSNPEEGFIQSGSTFFSKEILRTGLQFSRDFMRSNTVRHYKWETGGYSEHKYGDLHLIKEPEPEQFKYVIGGDAAEGKEGNDWDVNLLIEIRPTSPSIVIGYWRAHESDLYVQAMMVRDLAEWCKSSSTAIESDKFGTAINDHLRMMHCRGLYVATPEDEGKWSPGFNKSYGWKPSEKSRGIMLGQLQKALRIWYETPKHSDGLIVPFPEIWNELQAFVKIKNKAQATRGAHDDMVISLAIANSVAYDTTPKKAAVKEDQEKANIKWMKSIGLTHAAQFFKDLKKAKRG